MLVLAEYAVESIISLDVEVVQGVRLGGVGTVRGDRVARLKPGLVE
jgi:hypothetical protein